MAVHGYRAARMPSLAFPAALASAAMAYEVTTPVFEGPFDLLLHLILREQVDLYEVSLAAIVDAYLAEMERLEDLDLDVATEFLLIAATLVELKARRLLPGPRRRRPRRRAGPLGGARPAPGPAARVQDVQGRRPPCWPAWPMWRSRSFPAAAPLRSASPPSLPDLLEGVTAERLRDAFVRATTPKPVPQVDLDPRRPDPGQRRRRRRRAGRRAAPGRAHRLPPAHGRPRRAPGGHRALPGPARAVQAGPRRAGPGRPFGDIEIVWIGGGVDGAAVSGGVDGYEG